MWGWDARLREFVKSEEGRPFRWYETDCSSVTKRALEYAFGAQLCIPKLSQVDISNVHSVLSDNELTRIAHSFATTGDVVLSVSRGDMCFGVMVDGLVLTSFKDKGVVLMDPDSLPSKEFYRYARS